MKTIRYLLAAATLALLLAGCIPRQRVIWSPDGRYAVVLGAQEWVLYLSDGQGVLSGPFATNVQDVAWFQDSERLIVAYADGGGSWNDIEPLLDAPTKAWLTTTADELLEVSPTHRAWEAAVNGLFERQEATAAEVDAMKLFLAHARSSEIAEGVRDRWGELNVVGVNMVKTARVAGGRIVWGHMLASAVTPIFDLRISPSGSALAFTTGDTVSSQKKPISLRVVSTAGDRDAVVISASSAMYPDWSPDGTRLVYAEPVSGGANVDEEAVLGMLVSRQVAQGDGTLLEDAGSTGADELAAIMFSTAMQARYLPDGRILFSASELHLPAALEDVPPYAQLYVIDPAGPKTPVRVLPRSEEPRMAQLLTQLFVVSPDGRYVAVSGEQERFALFALRDGTLRELAHNPDSSSEQDEARMLPSWRGTNEVCFLRPVSDKTPALKAEVVLLPVENAGEPRVISADWPEAVTKDFLD